MDPAPTTSSSPRGSWWRSPWTELLLYVAAALLPWFVLDAQEQARWGGRAHLLWPCYSLMALPVLAAATMLVLRRSGSAGLDADAPAMDRTTRRLWALAAVAAAGIAVPLAVGHFHDLSMRPMSSVRSDQMPFIELALRDFWRDSRFPYHRFEVAHWYEPSVYPPFLWLQYTLPYWFSVDLRTITSASVLVLAAAAFGHALLGAARCASWPARAASAVPAAVPLLLFVLPTWHNSLFIVQTPCLWAMCALLAMAVRTRSWLSAGILLALCVCSRAWILFAILPMLVFSVRNRKTMGCNGLARFWGGLVLTGCAVGLPFLLFEPSVFVENVARSYGRFHATTIAANPSARHGFGLSQLLAAMRIDDAAVPLAVAAQAALFALACFRVRTERDVVRAMGLNVLWFSAFALVPFFYVFAEGLVLLAFAGPGLALESLPRRMVFHARTAFIALFATASLGFVGAGMFARPHAIDGTTTPLADSEYLISGFDRQGWVPRSSDAPYPIVDRHAYLSVPCDYPRLTKLALDVESDGFGEGAWLEVVLNGEPVGGFPLAEPGRYQHELHIPRKNLKHGGNELALHLDGRYGESSRNPADADLKLYRVHIGE